MAMRSTFKSNCLIEREPREQGFTLVEMLVVIGMIALLASLLLPALSTAKAKANSIKCRSNLRQLGLHLAMYVNDHSVYPSSRYVGTNLLGKARLFAGYMGESIFLTWPDEKGTKHCPARVHNGTGIFHSGDASYGYNETGYVGSKGPPPEGHFGLAERPTGPTTEAEVQVPSDMIALGDGFALLSKSISGLPEDTVWEGYGLRRQETSGTLGSGVSDRIKRAATRHQKRGNVVFCDGHVEAVRFRRLFIDRDDASLRQWNRDNEPHR